MISSGSWAAESASIIEKRKNRGAGSMAGWISATILVWLVAGWFITSAWLTDYHYRKAVEWFEQEPLRMLWLVPLGPLVLVLIWITRAWWHYRS